MDDQCAVIRGFVCKSLHVEEFSDEDDLFACGYASSLFAVQLVMFVEKAFGIKMTDQDLDMENFSSVANVDKFVSEKRAYTT